MEFLVHLLRVKAPGRLTPEQLKKLEGNCRHVDGPWWIMEGDPEYLDVRVAEVATGITSGLHPDDVAPGQPIIDHAVDIFNLPSWPPPSDWTDR